jgi:hypothetical protein
MPACDSPCRKYDPTRRPAPPRSLRSTDCCSSLHRADPLRYLRRGADAPCRQANTAQLERSDVAQFETTTPLELKPHDLPRRHRCRAGAAIARSVTNVVWIPEVCCNSITAHPAQCARPWLAGTVACWECGLLGMRPVVRIRRRTLASTRTTSKLDAASCISRCGANAFLGEPALALPDRKRFFLSALRPCLTGRTALPVPFRKYTIL